eukprot:3362854-Amphidinium_carterae.2
MYLVARRPTSDAGMKGIEWDSTVISNGGDYKAKLPHATLCEKLKQRDPANAVRVGDRAGNSDEFS